MSYNPKIYIRGYDAAAQRLFAFSRPLRWVAHSVQLLRSLLLKAENNDAVPPHLLLEGDMQSGADRLLLETGGVANGDLLVLDSTTAHRWFGRPVNLNHSAGGSIVAEFTTVNDFVERLLAGTHNFTSHTFKLALTNTAPTVAAVNLSGITQIGAGGGYTLGGYTLAGVTLTETNGVATIKINDLVITATGGSIGPFRYLVIYNDTASGDPLIGWYDRGSAITLASGESLTVDFDATTGAFTLT